MQEHDALGAPGFETIALAALSDAGRVRPENQDSLAGLENTSRERLMIVADGMGGHRGGETASRICLQMAERVFREPHGTPEERLRRGLELANEEIYSHSLANEELRGMGTTVVAALLAPDGGAWVAWVGDSRCYRLRNGALEQLTTDHSLMAEWIAIGVVTTEEAKTHPRRHELTRAVGQAPDVPIDLIAIDLRLGDRLLLCSDGLHGVVMEREVARALGSGSAEDAARALVDAANAHGGPDNVSVVVAVAAPAGAPVSEVESAPAPSAPPPPPPEIEAELAPLSPSESLTESESEASFADLGAEIADIVSDEKLAPEVLVPEAVPRPEPEPELLSELMPPSMQQIQIPRMTPVRGRRGLDLTSLIVGIAATLAIVGTGFGIWVYTNSGHAPEARPLPRPIPAVVHSTPPAPAPRPAAPPVAKPVVKPVEKPAAVPAAAPAVVPAPAPQIARREPPPAPPVQRPVAPKPLTPAAVNPPSVPAAAAPSPTSAGFELTPEVAHFVDAWISALETDDRVMLGALGFSDEPAAFAGAPGSRDGFRLVAAEIDEERSSAGRVYLRLVVSYAFRDATGRFRTQDEQRFILRNVDGRLRFEGRWQ